MRTFQFFMGKTKPQKDIILFIGKLSESVIGIIRNYGKETKQTFRIGLLYDTVEHATERRSFEGIDIVLPCDTTSPEAIQAVLEPYQKELLAVTARSERSLTFLKRVRPHIKYANLPSVESLRWTTSKIAMRKKLQSVDRAITPRYAVVRDTSKTTLDEIEKQVGFPLVVKPASLASSLLINICYYREELEKVLELVFRRVGKLQEEMDRNGSPEVLVEQFMEGDTFSYGAYITPRGKVHLCPLVEVKSGRTIGFDDFFGYLQITPVSLPKDEIALSEATARKAIQILDMRSTGAYIELVRTEEGWKIIELGPRIGGWRNDMYTLSYGINHSMNDILTRIPRRPVLSKRVKQHTAVVQFHAEKEGRLTKLLGVKRAQELSSFHAIRVRKKIGDMCRFAKHGDKPIFDITLSNKDRSKLLADIRRLEQMVKIETE